MLLSGENKFVSASCLICDKDLGLVLDDSPGTVSNAVLCQTDGNYGSRVLDNDGRLYFYICDVCLVQKRDKFRAFRIEQIHPSERHYPIDNPLPTSISEE
jgi:hypothetical protein